MACDVASNLAQPGDDIILDNQGVVKATPTPRKGTRKDKDYRGPGFANVTSKGLTARWTPGHRELKQTTAYRAYKDIIGNNDSDTLAKLGDNLPMELPPPKLHDILLQGHIMPTPAKLSIMQLRRQKFRAETQWISWKPLKHYRRNTWIPWLWGQVRWWGHGAPWERIPTL